LRCRLRLRSIFAVQKAVFVFGICPHLLHPCQKQPSTKTASFAASKKKSGLPGRSVRWVDQPRIPARTKAIWNLTSVVLLPRPRTAAMFFERSGETMNLPFGNRDFNNRSISALGGTLAYMPSRPKFISFFAGGRGLDLGLEQAGWECIAANEFDKMACETIRANAADLPLYAEDVRQVTAARLFADLGIGAGDLFAITGGPPCQAFSTAGRRLGLNDQRGNVFLHFLDLIDALQPKYAIFENVRGLLSAPLSHRPHAERGVGDPDLEEDEQPGGALKLILAKLRNSGYEVTFNLYNTANFGVPQSRERLVFIASRDGKRVPHLQPTHDAKGANGLLPWTTLRDAVAPLKKVIHHFSAFPAKRLEYYKLLGPGQNWRNLPPEVQEAAMGNSFHSGGGKTGFYRRLAWDKPSPTLVTRPNMKATDLCHPVELRPLSVEEYAAIQTFPPKYKFSGNLDDQYRQIGNAVPCLFAEAIGHHVTTFDRGLSVVSMNPVKLSRYVNTDESSWIGAAESHFLPGLFEPEARRRA